MGLGGVTRSGLGSAASAEGLSIFVVVILYAHIPTYIYSLGSSARFARAEAYGIILSDNIKGLYYEFYYGKLLRDNIEKSYYRILLRDNITEFDYGMILRENITESYYGYILRDNITEIYYGMIL